jgi:hypothetical protein
MDYPTLSNIPQINFHPRSHKRNPSLSPTRSPTRQRITEDILSDLSPATTLEAFTSESPSGKLRASVEAATPSERAFGIRATLAGKKIQEWVEELSAWPWPNTAGADGFEMPTAKRRKLETEPRIPRGGHPDGDQEPAEMAYMGSLPVHDVLEYEMRIDEIQDDMEELDVEGIKRTVLNTHFSARSRPSSSASDVAPMPTSLLGYTKMDDFTAIVTATVLQALPNLSRLTRLMDVWSIRLSVLHKVPHLLELLDEAEVALKSGWQAIRVSNQEKSGKEAYLERKAFEVMKNVLQDKVTSLGQDLDFMLDALEGREDTLPEHWLDRMEKIEADYGEWAVSADRKVREGEWARMAKRRKEEDAVNEAKRLEEERQQKLEEDRLQAEQDAVRLEQRRLQNIEDDRLRAEQELLNAEQELARLEAERLRILEEDRLQFEQDAARFEEERLQKIEENRLRAEQEYAVLEAEKLLKLNESKLQAELQQVKAARETVVRIEKEEAERLKASEEALEIARLDAEKIEQEELRSDRLRATKATLDAARLRAASIKAEEERLAANKLAQETAQLESQRIESIEEDTEELRRQDTVQIAEFDIQQTRVDDERLGLDNLAITPSLESAHEVNDAELRPLGRGDLVTETAPRSILKANTFAEPRVDDAASQQHRSLSAPELLIEDPSRNTDQTSENTDEPSTVSKPAPFDGNSESRRSSMATPEVEHIPLQPVRSGLDTSEAAPLPVLLPRPDTRAASSRLRPSALISEDLPERHNILAPCDDSDHDDETVPASPNPWADQVTLAPVSPQASISHIEDRKSTGLPHSENVGSQPTPIQPYSPAGGKYQTSYPPASSPTHDGTTIILLSNDRPLTPILGAISPVTDENGIHLNGDGVQESTLKMTEAIEVQDITPAVLDRQTSVTTIDSDPMRVDFSPRDNDPSKDSIHVSRNLLDATPIVPPSPDLVADTTEPFPDIEEQSPLSGRVGLRPQLFDDRSPTNSPAMKALPFDRSSIQLANAPELDASPSLTPITPTSDDTPNFPSLNTPPLPASFSSPKKTTTDDQLQAQISSLLESIPARIRLTSEPDVETNPLSPSLFSPNDTLRPKKVRRSLTPSIRSTSSLSIRAPTPSFTLAPAYGKSAPRPRYQNGNPEIKLYHLSRSTGEAPIKLFVRLVGENGERVMVRVGGGWADLGAYLREYASHHGRRVVSGTSEGDKVEIQDLPSRIASHSSTTTTSTARPNNSNNGRSSPIMRPSSVLERERPMSSLYVRKTRRSVGEQSESGTVNLSPSTPLPASPPRVSYDTPPSGSARSVSRLSWTEDEGGLGLAGPKSKPKAISERDAEWVESMKEKVRLASAEKEKALHRKDGSAGRKSFGEMEKVGGTKRLFKKGA